MGVRGWVGGDVMLHGAVRPAGRAVDNGGYTPPPPSAPQAVAHTASPSTTLQRPHPGARTRGEGQPPLLHHPRVAAGELVGRLGGGLRQVGQREDGAIGDLRQPVRWGGAGATQRRWHSIHHLPRPGEPGGSTRHGVEHVGWARTARANLGCHPEQSC